MTTNTPSAERRTSTSTISAPSASARSIAAIEFSAATMRPCSIQPPRCATTITWSRHRLACWKRSRISATLPPSAAPDGPAKESRNDCK